jgi:murein DD-endopeptidase MepM/ murein hydrolase activator NlpD
MSIKNFSLFKLLATATLTYSGMGLGVLSPAIAASSTSVMNLELNRSTQVEVNLSDAPNSNPTNQLLDLPQGESETNLALQDDWQVEDLRADVLTLQENYQTPPTPHSLESAAIATDTVISTPISVATASLNIPSVSAPTAVEPMTSPDLPPLAAVNTYLPDASINLQSYIWPAKGVLTSGFGHRWGRMHKGIDIGAPIGTPVVAVAAGVVVSAGWNDGGYGNLVEIQHFGGSVTLYAHNQRVLVDKGEQVEQGQQIAELGSTGRSTGPHLHFELHPSGKGAVDPLAFLPR